MGRYEPGGQAALPGTGQENDAPGTHDGAADDVIMRAVGAEIRRVRDHLGWTRATVVDRMSSTINIQTLANYEYGIRPCTLPRLVEICHALEVSAGDIVGLALQRAEIEFYSSIRIDLNAVVRDKQPELRPLRRWARNRLAEDPNGSTIARLDRAVLQEMAAFFGFTKAEFVKYLTRFIPDSAPQRTKRDRT